MKIIFRVLTLMVAVGLVSTAEAKTSKYELTNINSYGMLTLPGLELNTVTSAILTVTKNSPNFEPNILSLEISFANAEKLTVTNFKLVNGYKYRALLPDTWIYREVIVDVINFHMNQPLQIEVSVSDKTNFVDPISNGQTMSSMPLLSLLGELNEITPTRIIDQQVLTVTGKKLTLSLRDRVLFRKGSPTQGFSIDASWVGKGTKSLTILVDFPADMFDMLEAISLVVDGNINDPMISVKFKDQFGFEHPSPPARLHDLLDQAYGPNPWPPL